MSFKLISGSVVLGATLLSMGCSDNNSTDGGAAAVGGGGDAAADGDCVLGLCAPPAGEGVQLTLDATIPPGEENKFCKYVLLTEDLLFSGISHRYTDMSHHLLLYPTAKKAETVKADTGKDIDEVFPCTDVPDRGAAGVLYSAQTPANDEIFPASAAYPVTAGLVVLIEYHVINTGDREREASVRVNLTATHEDVVNYVGSLFFYDSYIVVPPLGTASAQMHCEIPIDINLIGGASHMHKRGIGQETWVTGPDGTRLHDLYHTTEWDEPTPQSFDPPVQVQAGQFIDYRCDYRNGESRMIVEGSETTDEMCMSVWRYYAPKEVPALDFGTKLCWASGSGAVFDGAQTCSETRAKLEPVRARYKQFVLDFRAANGKDPTFSLDVPDDLRFELETVVVGTSSASSRAYTMLFGPVMGATGGCSGRMCEKQTDAAGAVLKDADGFNVPGPCWLAADNAECNACLQEFCATEVAACDAAR